MRRKYTLSKYILIIALTSLLLAYVYSRVEGFESSEDTPKVTDAQKTLDAQKALDTNKKNLMEYCKYILVLGQIVDPATKAGGAIHLAIITMSGGAFDIKDMSATMAHNIEVLLMALTNFITGDLSKKKQCASVEGIFKQLAMSKLDDIGKAIAELKKIYPNDVIKMDAPGIRTFIYTIKDAVATSSEAVQAYTFLKESINSDTVAKDNAAKILICKMPSILLDSVKKDFKGTAC